MSGIVYMHSGTALTINQLLYNTLTQ